MEEKELPQLHEWGLKVSRLLELIALTNRTLQMHQEQGDSPGQMRDYQLLLQKHQAELNGLMQTYGLSVHIARLDSAA